MSITPNHIRHTLDGYAAAHPGEKAALSAVFTALDRADDLTSRTTFPLHVTAGAVLVGDAGDVLLVHHRGTGRWLTPGGHLEPEDADLPGAARRELGEETGVRSGVVPVLDGPLHIDVHPIPANPAKGEPAHHHADVRYLFRVAGNVETVIQEEEVSGVQWRPLDTLPTPLSTRVTTALR